MHGLQNIPKDVLARFEDALRFAWGSVTVKLLIRDSQKNHILVHERGDGTPEGKKPGWSFPGGGRDKESFAKFDKTFRELLVRCGMTFEEARPFLEEFPLLDDQYILAAVREAMEETGYLVKIERPLLYEPHFDTGHMVILYLATPVFGKLIKETEETDDAGWFASHDIPMDQEDPSQSIYPSEYARLQCSLQILGEQKLSRCTRHHRHLFSNLSPQRKTESKESYEEYCLRTSREYRSTDAQK